MRARKWASIGLGGWLVLFAHAATATAGPAGDANVTQEQLEYSKKLFSEGEEAMKAKDFTTAVTKYKEAYRYAPHLHLFSYNIAVAAEAAGDCKTAHVYYGRFLDLVMEHPERKKVEKKIEKLRADCPFDQETEVVVSTENREDRARDREAEKKARAMNEALTQLLAAERLYTEGAKRFKDSKEFKRAARRKQRHAKRMEKLLSNHQVKRDLSDPAPVELPSDPKKACNRARSRENKVIKALEEVLDLYDTREAYRVINRFLRSAENRELPSFEACS